MNTSKNNPTRSPNSGMLPPKNNVGGAGQTRFRQGGMATAFQQEKKLSLVMPNNDPLEQPISNYSPNAFQTRQQHQTQSSMAFSSRLLIEDYDGRSDPMLTNQIGPDYFKTIFKDVSNRSVTPRTENMPSNFVDNVAFFEYTKLPGIICDRFFSMFSKQQPGNFVVESEFVRGFLQVYLSSLEKKIELTFKM